MSVAHDLDLVEEEKRKQSARILVAELTQTLDGLKARAVALENGDDATWRDVRAYAMDVIHRGQTLQLGLLVACAKEVLYFAERRFATQALKPDVVIFMLSALETLGMELVRLQRDHDLH